MLDKPQSYLSFDFGMKNIGIAVGQIITGSATALPALKAKDGIPHWPDILLLIDQWEACALIVGIPLNMDGSTQSMTFCARKFARRLHSHSKLPVYEIDERLTTVEAKQLFHTQAKKAKIAVDSFAAKLILESWFNQQQ